MNKKEILSKEIEKILNALSIENNSDIPDFIISDFLLDCLLALEKAVERRKKWEAAK